MYQSVQTELDVVETWLIAHKLEKLFAKFGYFFLFYDPKFETFQKSKNRGASPKCGHKWFGARPKCGAAGIGASIYYKWYRKRVS